MRRTRDDSEKGQKSGRSSVRETPEKAIAGAADAVLSLRRGRFHKACMDLRLVFSWNDGFELCFPARMNPNPAILRVLADAGCQILCGSEAELRLSRRADIDGAQMIYAPMAEDAHAGAYARRIGAAYSLTRRTRCRPFRRSMFFSASTPAGACKWMGGPSGTLKRASSA